MTKEQWMSPALALTRLFIQHSTVSLYLSCNFIVQSPTRWVKSCLDHCSDPNWKIIIHQGVRDSLNSELEQAQAWAVPHCMCNSAFWCWATHTARLQDKLSWVTKEAACGQLPPATPPPACPCLYLKAWQQIPM